MEHEHPIILVESHERIVGGQYKINVTLQKILRAELWWQKVSKYANEYCQNFDFYQRVGKPSRKDEMPLKPHVTFKVFDKWAIYFVGPINPPSRRSGARYIITVIQYLTAQKLQHTCCLNK